MLPALQPAPERGESVFPQSPHVCALSAQPRAGSIVRTCFRSSSCCVGRPPSPHIRRPFNAGLGTRTFMQRHVQVPPTHRRPNDAVGTKTLPAATPSTTPHAMRFPSFIMPGAQAHRRHMNVKGYRMAFAPTAPSWPWSQSMKVPRACPCKGCATHCVNAEERIAGARLWSVRRSLVNQALADRSILRVDRASVRWGVWRW